MIPILSIVSGSYQRLASLQRMVASVRQSIPRGISYEVIVVDGGSTDGTQDWCKAQSDIVLIEHKELRGAIRAFCDGAKMAHGDYVLLSNDDVVIIPGSIMRALVHLETHPTCGAVAFADDRPAPGYENERSYKVQGMTVRTIDGNSHTMPYAQVGLFRRWLGDAAGWWGADDPVMGAGHTYGGDNYLSARIWEFGYSVDTLTGVYCQDRLVQDGLRQKNMLAERKNPAVYYKRYPQGPVIAQVPAIPNPQAERLRILYLPIFEANNPTHKANKRGLREALTEYGLVYEMDYVNEPFNLVALVQEFKPHLLLSQFHGADIVTPRILYEARQAAPGMVVCNWNGDAHAHGLTSDAMLALLKQVDLQLVVNAYPLEEYRKQGIQAAYWQIGIETPLVPPETIAVPSYDILFLGNMNSQFRRDLEMAIRTAAGQAQATVGFYGQHWRGAAGKNLYDFSVGEALYGKCKIAISDQGWPQTEGFVSNRLFQALAGQAFVLQQTSHGLDRWTGLRDGIHYVGWSDLRDLQLKIKRWIVPKRSGDRKRIALSGQRFVLENYSFPAQVKKLFFELLPNIQREVIPERV